MTKVIPIFKKGDKMNMINYRPISLTNPIAKIFEKLMHQRISSYFQKYKILYAYQFGFRKSYSTTFAVLDVVSMIENAYSQGKYTIRIFLDLSKEFEHRYIIIQTGTLRYQR